MKKKLFMGSAIVYILIWMFFTGCQIVNPKPVTLSAEYRTQVESAVVILETLEGRFALESDPNDCKLAMKTARESLQIILDADAGGSE